MKTRYRLIRRGSRGGKFYCKDTATGKRTSLNTTSEDEAQQIGIKGVSLHSYRYAWAERAKIASYPERFVMENLEHNSKAVHRAYAKRALVKIPSLEDYENKIVQLNPTVNDSTSANGSSAQQRTTQVVNQ